MLHHQKLSQKRHNVLLAALLIALCVAALIFITIAIYVNTQLKNSTILSEDAQVRGISYEVTQQPAKPVAGQPIVFKVHITKDNSPIQATEFNVGTSHSYGIFSRDTGLDPNISQKTYSDKSGDLTFSYTPEFNYPTKDTYGFSVAPNIEEVAIKREFDSREASGVDRVGGPLGPTFNVVIYPRWLSAFRLK